MIFFVYFVYFVLFVVCQSPEARSAPLPNDLRNIPLGRPPEWNAIRGGSPVAVGLPTMVETTLHAFLAGVRERFGPRVAEIRLFGSYARGDATRDSDVDCLIYCGAGAQVAI